MSSEVNTAPTTTPQPEQATLPAQTAPKARGRPRIKLDWEELDKLLEMHATLREVAGWFRVSEDTIEAAVKRVKHKLFSEYSELKRGKGDASLRRKQIETAMDGNVTMQIWLGKQYLGQTDKAIVLSNKVEAQDDEFIKAVTEDPEVAKQVTAMLERIQSRKSSARGAGDVRKPGPVDAAAAPQPAQP